MANSALYRAARLQAKTNRFYTTIRLIMTTYMTTYVFLFVFQSKVPGNSGQLRYDTRCYFNVRSKADMSLLNLPHGTDN